MTKKTRRKLPRGQRAQHGPAAGYEEHGPGCQCRQCRTLASLGRGRNPQLAVRQMVADHIAVNRAAGVDPGAELAESARDVRIGMENLGSAITDVALAGGRLLALLDNQAGTETLSSIQADQGYQLMRGLNDAHVALIDFWIQVGKGLG